jgi:predicted ATPase
MKLRLCLFGSPTIECGDESFALPFERRSQLLVFLALRRSWVGRAELAAMLWPEQERKLAHANLRKIVFRLQLAPWSARVESQGGALRFDAETDVADFESALREGRNADALTLRRGELLSGFDDDGNEAWSNWLRGERDRLRVAWRSAALDRVAADINAGQGIALSARLLDADPLDEAALHAHMSWLARDGQSARARQAYREFSGRLAEDLALAPGAELAALHDSLATTVPLRAADDGFIGRSVELRAISALLAQDDCRLLSLVGPGGVGKTRLAQRAIDELETSFSDGVAFISLEDLRVPSEFGARLAHGIGVDPTDGRDPLDHAIDVMRERRMLLVLDNFEQLAAGASMLDRLLQACARLKIIVTSRSRLGVTSEWLLPVEGLPCPEVEDEDRVEAFDAVRLFVKAARRVAPTLNVTAEAAAIGEICRRVEGLPLALEFAAAWTRVLSCEAIAAELRQGSTLLRDAAAAYPARHASIDVVFDDSWRRLSGPERDALSRLSVFRGGFSPEEARAVAGASLHVLGALADQSLLRKEDARLHLHPLVQQWAARQRDARRCEERACNARLRTLRSPLTRSAAPCRPSRSNPSFTRRSSVDRATHAEV